MEPGTDLFAEEDCSAIGSTPFCVIVAEESPADLPWANVRIGVDRTGSLACPKPDAFDILLTVKANAPAPWASISPGALEQEIARLTTRIAANPVAATTLARLIRMTGDMPFADAIMVESLAYSTLLGGSEFRHWLASRQNSAPSLPARVDYERMSDEAVTLTLASPEQDNAMSASMRDALYEALANVLVDPSTPTLTLQARGRCFSTGGALGEFGMAEDLALAHLARTQRSASLALHRLGERATVIVDGAAIGSGAEIAAAAHRRIATSRAWIHLPEVNMGLIPGAGGTVTLPRAIGRHRALWLMIGERRLTARQCLSWGFFHELIAA